MGTKTTTTTISSRKFHLNTRKQVFTEGGQILEEVAHESFGVAVLEDIDNSVLDSCWSRELDQALPASTVP